MLLSSLAADGRGLQEQTINNNFATLSEALYIAERKAREELEYRSTIKQKVLVSLSFVPASKRVLLFTNGPCFEVTITDIRHFVLEPHSSLSKRKSRRRTNFEILLPVLAWHVQGSPRAWMIVWQMKPLKQVRAESLR